MFSTAPLRNLEFAAPDLSGWTVSKHIYPFSMFFLFIRAFKILKSSFDVLSLSPRLQMSTTLTYVFSLPAPKPAADGSITVSCVG
jgi:hypothetical protein